MIERVPREASALKSKRKQSHSSARNERSPLSRRRPNPIELNNARIAELLALEAANATGHLQRAFSRAARNAFLWPEEAAELVQQNRLLTELAGVGPFLSKTIQEWINSPPPAKDIPPIRSEFLTLSQARMILLRDPSWATRYHGDLQMHTTWSDGSGSVTMMAQTAIERGYEYIAITDHSKGLKIARGINETQLREQAAEIKEINAIIAGSGSRFRVLQSIELNLNPRGEGDMAPESLAKLDIVLGSFHSALRGTEDQTERYIMALRNPSIQILGHPRGRVYNYRIGLIANWGKVFDEAARLDKAIEVDAYPDRQDLNVTLLKLAKKAGCRISIDTDAHHPWQLTFVELGLGAVLEADIPAERVINFMPRKKLLSWVNKVRGR
jgi:putative hydrolase